MVTTPAGDMTLPTRPMDDEELAIVQGRLTSFWRVKVPLVTIGFLLFNLGTLFDVSMAVDAVRQGLPEQQWLAQRNRSSSLVQLGLLTLVYLAILLPDLYVRRRELGCRSVLRLQGTIERAQDVLNGLLLTVDGRTATIAKGYLPSFPVGRHVDLVVSKSSQVVLRLDGKLVAYPWSPI